MNNRTVKNLIEDLQNLVARNPQCANWPIIYSTDDERNSYHTIYYEPNYTQVEDINQRYLEVVGHYSEDNDNIDLKDCNCVIIN